MIRILQFLVLVLVSLSGRQTAVASQVILQLAGTIDSVGDDDGLLPADITAGTPFTGILHYDDSQPDELPLDADRGEYHFPAGSGLAGLILSIAGHEFRTDPAALLRLAVGNNVPTGIHPLPTGDTFALLNTSLLGPFSTDYRFISFYWRNPTGDMFSSDELPAVLSSDAFDLLWIQFSGGGSTQLSPVFFIEAHIDSIVVPEPSGIALLAIAAACLVCCKRR